MSLIKTNCHKCKYYYVTWEPSFPNGCKALAFKTKEMPSLAVLKSSGKECLYFEKKDYLKDNN